MHQILILCRSVLGLKLFDFSERISPNAGFGHVFVVESQYPSIAQLWFFSSWLYTIDHLWYPPRLNYGF